MKLRVLAILAAQRLITASQTHAVDTDGDPVDTDGDGLLHLIDV